MPRLRVLVASQASFAHVASTCLGTLSWAAVGVDGEMLALTTLGDGNGVQAVVDIEHCEEGCGLEYLGGRGRYEAEAFVELKLGVPFREAFPGPLEHVPIYSMSLCLERMRVTSQGV
jgi:hypothetical protein